MKDTRIHLTNPIEYITLLAFVSLQLQNTWFCIRHMHIVGEHLFTVISVSKGKFSLKFRGFCSFILSCVFWAVLYQVTLPLATVNTINRSKTLEHAIFDHATNIQDARNQAEPMTKISITMNIIIMSISLFHVEFLLHIPAGLGDAPDFILNPQKSKTYHYPCHVLLSSLCHNLKLRIK